MTPQARAIINEIAEQRGIDPALITRPCRKPRVYRARMEVAKRLDARGYSSPRIGALLNHDHATILFYLGRGKKKATEKPRWRRPHIRVLLVIKPPKPPKPAKSPPPRRPIPFAGFDPTDRQWVRRPRAQENNHVE